MSCDDPNPSTPDAPKRSYRLSHAHRLHGKRGFDSVFEGQMRKSAGPLLCFSIPNTTGHPRLGLSVSRRVGNAVKRNRIKRLLREAFRLTQYDWPAGFGYDVVLVVRPHDALKLEAYQDLLRQIMQHVHPAWLKRQRKQAAAAAASPQSPTDPPAPQSSDTPDPAA